MSDRVYPAIQAKGGGKLFPLTNESYASVDEAKRVAYDLGLCRRRQKASTWLFGDMLVIAQGQTDDVMCKYEWTADGWEWVVQ